MPKKKSEITKFLTKEYAQILSGLKKEIRQAQIEAATLASERLINLYWSIGKTLDERQEKSGWGSKLIDTLAKDLQSAFPGIKGFSRTNIYRMTRFYRAYNHCPTAVGQLEKLPIFRIPWAHNIVIFEKGKSPEEMLWYAEKTLEYGLSRNALEDYFKTKLYEREGAAITNFKQALPAPHSDMASQTLKDPYVFDFLTLREGYVEKDLEDALVSNIQKTLLELGKGFAFIGRQYHLEISNSDYYLDLLFYHIRLKCFVVIELKTTEFKPEHTGQLNFYLSAVDDLLKDKDDKPTIGLLLCKTKDKFKAEYALRRIHSPIGIAEYETKLVASLPKKLKNSLPTVEEIESELEKQQELEDAEKK